MLLNNWREIVEARKRVCYKRALAKRGIEFNVNDSTAALKTLYYAFKGHIAQVWPEEYRKHFRRWGETEILREVRDYEEREARRKEWEAEREAARAFIFGDRNDDAYKCQCDICKGKVQSGL
jgi:hypothetical protein